MTVSTARQESSVALDLSDEGFEAVMRAHNQRLFRIARSILKSDAEAEDVVQLSYVAAYTKLSQFGARASLGSWLCRIVVNHSIDRLRQIKRERKMSESQLPLERWRRETKDVEGPEQEAARRELRRLLEEAIDHLPDDLRAVFVMRDVEGMTGAETGDSLGIEDGTVRVRLHRARSRLRQWLGRRAESHVRETFAFAGERCDRIVSETLRHLSLAESGS